MSKLGQVAGWDCLAISCYLILSVLYTWAVENDVENVAWLYLGKFETITSFWKFYYHFYCKRVDF